MRPPRTSELVATNVPTRRTPIMYATEVCDLNT